jgi:hypothetical protein
MGDGIDIRVCFAGFAGVGSSGVVRGGLVASGITNGVLIK